MLLKTSDGFNSGENPYCSLSWHASDDVAESKQGKWKTVESKRFAQFLSKIQKGDNPKCIPECHAFSDDEMISFLNQHTISEERN